jgi:tripartite-type tricarboxylate transporter receptor subunit TctC
MRGFGVLALTVLHTALLLAGAPAQAQDAYPTQTVKIVVPAAAGSTNDTLTRITADRLSRKWGKPVVVENIAGGGMNTGSGLVARATPDGHTMLVAPPSPFTITNLLSKDLNYAPSDFVPITMLAKIANVLAVRKSLPANSLAELIAYAKANPGKLTFATGGPGSTSHLSAAQLEGLAGIKMVAVPYRGAQLALNDIIAGNIDMFFATLATSVPLWRADKLKILAVADTTRAKTVPELPTFSEAGVPGFRSITWFGLAAPKGTPAALAQRINRDVVEVLREKEVEERLAGISLEVGATDLAATRKFFDDETALWSKVIKEAGITPQ